MRAIKTTPQPDREKEIKMLKECDPTVNDGISINIDPKYLMDPSILNIRLPLYKGTQKKSKAK